MTNLRILVPALAFPILSRLSIVINLVYSPTETLHSAYEDGVNL